MGLYYSFFNRKVVVYLYKFDMSYDSVRERIFVLLKEQKLTQKELAERLEISPQTVTDWKKKKSNSFMEMLGNITCLALWRHRPKAHD